MSIAAIFSILGYCVGALSVVSAVTGYCIKRCGCCKDDEPEVIEGTSGDQAEGVALQEETKV